MTPRQYSTVTDTPSDVGDHRGDAVAGAVGAAEREATLVEWLREQGSVAIGFSGGVDSSYLACVAIDVLGAANVVAVIGRSATYPAVQWERARSVAERFGVPVVEVDTDELHDPRYAANPANRCYFCKSELWSRVLPVARAQGMSLVLDGTNADDLHGHRPGRRAADEQGVRSPLAELGFSKDDIRILSRRRDIPTWSQPASPCLASRLPQGTAVTVERLARVERAEDALRALGVSGDLRVRDHGEVARVELGPAELDAWLSAPWLAGAPGAVRAAGFPRVAVDLEGFRSGSLSAPRAVKAPLTSGGDAGSSVGGAGDGTRDALADRASATTSLAADLTKLGIDCRVEARGSLAVVTAGDLLLAGPSPIAGAFAGRALRAAVVDAAHDLGFTHVALESRGENG